MLGRILVSVALASTMAMAELKEKGPFIGIDFQKISDDSLYETSGSAFPYPRYSNKGDFNNVNFKLGYQYYLTRLYLSVSQPDTTYDTYSVKSTEYDMNFEYVPVFYYDSGFALRGIFGASIGMSDNELYGLSDGVKEQHEILGFTKNSQQRIIYGWQAGIMVEMDIGLSLELGWRQRHGTLIEFTDQTNKVTVETKRQHYYLGLNYLF